MTKIDYSIKQYLSGGRVTAAVDGEPIGTLTVERPEAETVVPVDPKARFGQGRLFHHSHPQGQIGLAQVHSDYQRQGVGTDMLNLAQQQFGTVSHSYDISPEAYAWAQKTGGHVPVAENETTESWDKTETDDFSFMPRETGQYVGSRRLRRPNPMRRTAVQGTLF